MSKPFYVTTPIYYVNDEPHLGHAYTTILADVLARYHRLRGQHTFFLTGTDEHGQKVQEAAQQRSVTPQALVDEMSQRFREAWDYLNVSYDDFIRTTQERHVHVVESILQNLWEQGEIYRGEYVGWYCVPDERFWTEKDLVNGRCPACGRAVQQILEPNYFFRMSNYQEWLIDYINTHPNFIQPETRRHEVLGFLRRPLGDLCISRPATRLSWGIPLPFDPDYVTYVWFDALINYVTAAGYLEHAERFARLWPQALHLIGKDILTTHAVYWPTMLHAAGLPQPCTIFAHGWWVIGGAKMSKSRGEVVKPLDLADVYGVDGLRYFLMREMTPGRDADFSAEGLDRRYQAELANDLGNLLRRLVHMTMRYHEGRVPEPGELTDEHLALQARSVALPEAAFKHVEALAVNDALAEVMEVVGDINRYLERTSPWQRAKEGKEESLATILYTAMEALRLISILLQPVMPERMTELWHRLGWQPPEKLHQALTWGQLRPGSPVVAGEPLFPRDVA